MEVIVRFFGPFIQLTGTEGTLLDLPQRSTVRDIVAIINHFYPQLSRFQGDMIVLLNDSYPRPETELNVGDVIKVFSPDASNAELFMDHPDTDREI